MSSSKPQPYRSRNRVALEWISHSRSRASSSGVSGFVGSWTALAGMQVVAGHVCLVRLLGSVFHFVGNVLDSRSAITGPLIDCNQLRLVELALLFELAGDLHDQPAE